LESETDLKDQRINQFQNRISIGDRPTAPECVPETTFTATSRVCSSTRSDRAPENIESGREVSIERKIDSALEVLSSVHKIESARQAPAEKKIDSVLEVLTHVQKSESAREQPGLRKYDSGREVQSVYKVESARETSGSQSTREVYRPASGHLARTASSYLRTSQATSVVAPQGLSPASKSQHQNEMLRHTPRLEHRQISAIGYDYSVLKKHHSGPGAGGSIRHQQLLGQYDRDVRSHERVSQSLTTARMRRISHS